MDGTINWGVQENSKPEEYLTAEDQRRQQKTREWVDGIERAFRGSDMNQLIAEDKGG